MEIVSGMARITIRRRAFELKIGVTLGTGDGCVLAGQLEDGTVVIEAGGLPAAGWMTRGAICAKRAAMRIGLAVAGGAVRRCAFE
jgi:hypothetical protein